MYSVVLMMALTVNTEAPEFGKHGCCGCYSGCHGCYGGYGCCGCYGGYGCCGCYGGCYGGYGCCGCYGGCYGGGYGGCYGGGYGCCGCYSYSGCYGGCYGGYASVYSGGYTVASYATPVVTTVARAEPTGPTPATLIVNLPANAKLTVDGQVTKSTTSTRTFVTPPLELGKTFEYTLKATVDVGAKTEVITKVVKVVAGQQTQETMSLPAAAVASAGND